MGVPSDVSRTSRTPLAAKGDRGTTAVHVGSMTVGGPNLAVVAGPCAVEDLESLLASARGVAGSGAHALRAGAFKPRTSPYSFAGLGRKGLELLARAKAETGLPVVTEVVDAADIDAVAAVADCLQIGARNMQNFALLHAVGAQQKPVLLKRGFGCTVDELLFAAEHVMHKGNTSVIVCERGIRTFETNARFTLDVAAIAWLKQRTHLPVMVDPSHAAGAVDLVTPLALAGIAAGADGLLVEVHSHPEHARSDGEQALTLANFRALMAALAPLATALGRRLEAPAGAR